MKRMAEAKKKYDDVAIPKELSERIMFEIKRGEKRHKTMTAKKKRISYLKRAAAIAAALLLLFGAGLNTSEAFAREMYGIPVIGALAKVLTVRSYETKTEDLEISVEIPSIEMIAEEFKGLEKEINEDIYAFCEQYVQEATVRAEEYKRAFLDTGGTREEWEAHAITIKVWYEVKSQTDKYLSVAVVGTENWSSAYSEERYYNLDLETGRWITLQDVLGKDYQSIVDQSILRQIALKEESGETYWTDGWEGIDENTKFYMNQNQNPVIVLDKYEIAPGAAGQQEFEIKEEVEQEDGTAPVYEDNFAVDGEAVAAYARRVKEAVAQKDIEKLADLTAFPVYVGLPEENPVVETREAFLAIGVERLLPEEMLQSIEAADENSLCPSMAGFTLYGEDGAPGITFSVRDGRLAISGINY